MFKKLFKAEGGFTLVELLVTLAILGVLFGIVTLTLSGVGSDAQETVCDAELGVVQSAIDIYLATDTSIDPATIDLNTGSPDFISNGTTGFQQYIQGTTLGKYEIEDGIVDSTTAVCPGS